MIVMLRRALAALPFILLLVVSPLRAAEAPAAILDRFHETLVTMMKRGPQLGFQGRVKFFSPVADQTFDYKDMTQRSVGPSWTGIDPKEQAKLVAAFRKFSIYTYAHQFRSYDGERFERVGEPQTGKKGGVLVRTQLIPTGDDPVTLNYLLHQTPGWKIYDIYLQGTISEVARRRDDFASILRDKGPAGMAAALDEKSAQLEAEDAKTPVQN
jgi:phospholipid transport system substrate-binding protein